MSRYETEELLLALSRFEREAADRLGVTLTMGPVMALALAELQSDASSARATRPAALPT